MAFDIALIVAAFGAYYEDSGQNMQRLVRQLRAAIGFEELMRTIVTQNTVWKAAEARTTEVVQAFQKGWTPKGLTEFIPVEIYLEKFKVDIEIMPDDISASWLGFLEGLSDLDRRNWPFVRYLLEQEFLPQIAQDMELKEAFHGVKTAVVPGTPSAAGLTVNGINQLRKDWHAAARLGTLAVGAPPTDPKLFVGYVETFAAEIPSIYRGKGYTIAMSPDLFLRYQKGFTELYGGNYSVNAMDNMRVLHHNFKVKGYEAMAGSDVIFTTPKENLICLKKAAKNDSNFMVETLKRNVFIHNHFYKGYGIEIPEIFFTNPVEL